MRRQIDEFELRREIRDDRVATASMACPACDAPVLPARAMTPAEPIGCPYCAHQARVRDFLSFGVPVRPARVTVRLRP